MLTSTRRNEIAKQLIKNGNIQTIALAKYYNVSTETIRKDIIYLEKQGIAKKSYGGAVAVDELIEQPLARKEIEHIEAKSQIARIALKLIPANSTIFLDAGSTTYALAKQLLNTSGFTIFTNSLKLADMLLASENKIFCLGGLARPSSKAIVGDWAIEQLKSVHINIAFLGSDGFKNLNGATTASFEELQLKKAIMSSSEANIVLADNSKFKSTSLFQFCNWSDLTALITNETDDEEILAEIKAISEQTKVLTQ